jgi:hypothetical protein
MSNDTAKTITTNIVPVQGLCHPTSVFLSSSTRLLALSLHTC